MANRKKPKKKLFPHRIYNKIMAFPSIMGKISREIAQVPYFFTSPTS